MNHPTEKSSKPATSPGSSLPPLPTIWLGVFAAGSMFSLFLGIGLGYFFFGTKGSGNEIAPGAVANQDQEQPTEVPSTPPEIKPEAETKAEATAKPKSTIEDPEQAIRADIEEAISLIDKRSLTLFAHSLLHPHIRLQLEAMHSRSHRRSDDPPPLFDERQLATLKWHLQSSLKAQMEFNRNKTIAELKYKLIQPKEPEYQVPKDLPAADRKPQKAVPGLGDDLKTMLTKAADLIEKEQFEKFINNVYPLADLGRLEQGDAMQRHLLRVQNESMKTAMLRDLKIAAGSKAEIQGNVATVSLAPFAKGDRPRKFKFELVDNNWRFIDSNKKARAELVKLAGMPPAKINSKLEQGSMVMTLTDEGWRLTKLPD